MLDSHSVMQELGSTEAHIPSKAFFVVSHANHVHPSEAVVVTYNHNPILNSVLSLFKVAKVDGKPDCYRPVYHLHGGTKKQKRNVLHEYLAAVQQARVAGSAPPVLLAQVQVFCTGLDGLQVRQIPSATCQTPGLGPSFC